MVGDPFWMLSASSMHDGVAELRTTHSVSFIHFYSICWTPMGTTYLTYQNWFWHIDRTYLTFMYLPSKFGSDTASLRMGRGRLRSLPGRLHHRWFRPWVSRVSQSRSANETAISRVTGWWIHSYADMIWHVYIHSYKMLYTYMCCEWGSHQDSEVFFIFELYLRDWLGLAAYSISIQDYEIV
jgi:hypothetical protein